MRTVVVYESVFGNTRRVAEAIGRALSSVSEVVVVPVDAADEVAAASADLLVVGGPTHLRGMSTRRTRYIALGVARGAGRGVVVDPVTGGTGLREWLARLDRSGGWGAAFDTRFGKPVVLTGRASPRVHHRLLHLGRSMLDGPESFLLGNDGRLQPGEEDRAYAWGKRLAVAAELSPASAARASASSA